MSTIGKFFVVLNLALAALFVGASASLIAEAESFRTKYEGAVETHAGEVADLNAQVADWTSKYQDAMNENRRLQQQNGQLAADKSALEESLASERQSNTELTERLQGIEGKLADLEGTNREQTNRISELTRQNETLRGERDDALDSRDGALAQATQATEAMQLAQGQASDLSLALARETERADEAEAQLDAVVTHTGVDPATINNQPQLEGLVLSTETANDTTYVVINIGKQAGVKVGYTFDVYNGATYKGRIKVQTVNETKAAATLEVPGNGSLASGDRIATRL